MSSTKAAAIECICEDGVVLTGGNVRLPVAAIAA